MPPRWSIYGCAALVVTAVLAPLARAGYVLRYDMVFVPRQSLTWDLVAPSGVLPRAVPQDALVGLSALIVPGWLAQRLVLAGLLAAAAIGAGRLVPARRGLTRVVAAIGYAWTPFLAERLLIGQWGLLLCYAALPWLVRAALDAGRGRAGAGARVVLAAACASITPTGGIIALATTLAFARRRAPVVPLAVAALNAPWLLVAAGSATPATSSPDAVASFAARAENWGGVLVALAGTGGIWNAGAVPASRTGPLVPLITLGLLVAAGFGFGRLRRRWPDGAATRLARLAAGGLLLAAWGALPGPAGLLRWAVVAVPGAGLFRDGQKFLIPYALGLILCLALAAERIAERLPAAPGRLVLAGFALLPVVALPDLAWGAGGKLRPVSYPADWASVAGVVRAEPGPVVSLPMSAYRSYSWNPGPVVYDPASRYLPAEVIADDRLRIALGAATRTIRGESETAAAVRARVEAGGPAADERVRWVLVQRDAGGPVPVAALAGLVPVHLGPALELYRNPGYRAPAGRVPLLGLAGYLLAGSVVAIAGWRRFGSRRENR
ncbi:hypothetical protein [Actinoplanes regularis]|uniref:Uncharacterized protein n=1 Tax=Actinoplanes regularis TaxID=52697 RepID=A0A238Z5L7_9ACTN|nr:hypothetical protein [Actinoplanes regularis]GIE85819.1 hypothetical protein Are01nite_22990 [Actinoplanes regularis]SNR78268.1 hypothetical protein SAMN06264365_105433 [Actinoplanes regularis]